MTGACNYTVRVFLWHPKAWAWLALCSVILAACGTSESAPVVDRSYGDRQVHSAATSVHVVRRGETVYGIAQRYDISTRALIDRNKLRPPYRLAAGSRLYLPPLQAYSVRRGDTLYAISRRHGVDMASLARANRLRSPYRINVGQRLILPFDTRKGRALTTQMLRAQPAQKPRSSSIARALRGPPSANGVPRPRPKPVFRPSLPVPSRDAEGFIWPVDGRVLSSFGPKASALHNDGMNIAAPLGAPVRAADNGVVAYAGDQIRGFGNMLLIKHSGGLITAYAHADKLLVARGDVVSRGQVIAWVGKSGDIDAPQLHFEVRKGSQAVDPRKFLPS